ncbi:MAG: AbrB family transcriptional regulator [Omnitrophica WOR_2 bacterium RIFCSPLOWO2_12_FULL_50_9]|nr:MAG: AbrB family transcriptional regulator [Omnitrophica WOR_2 bacterium RIFCSPHIGHO2_02_FULL_50_17]OGX42484.1 MAG: AbrB family transcriptional regulator [Omnitrophica WOR_2 bacterium RIFCSPLOWO2_12_FULL_50_9]
MVMQIRQNFQITLPAEIRKKLHLEVGDFLETEIKDGRVIIKPQKTIDAQQAWFWSKEWQEGEKEAQADLEAGKVKKFKNVEDLIADLDK